MFYTLTTRPAAIQPANRMLTPFAHDSQRQADSHVERFLSKVASDAFSPFFSGAPAPAVQIKTLEAGYELQFDVPGVAREHLDIGIEGDVVRVTSKEGAARDVKAAWRFPLEIDATASKAKLEHGVLSLQLAKKLPVSNVTQLAIE